jgi:hypothetical protein
MKAQVLTINALWRSAISNNLEKLLAGLDKSSSESKSTLWIDSLSNPLQATVSERY